MDLDKYTALDTFHCGSCNHSEIYVRSGAVSSRSACPKCGSTQFDLRVEFALMTDTKSCDPEPCGDCDGCDCDHDPENDPAYEGE
jgi:predicted nucleic-acid-binding Zn-ribbon protein